MLYRYQAGLGAVPNGVTVSVRELQQQLIRAGFNVGATGADGVWGSNTQGALHRAFRAANLPGGADWAYEASRGSITLTAKAWRVVQNIPAGRGGESQPTRAPTAPLEPYETDVPVTPLEEAPNMTPWLIAGGALLATGAYFYFRKKAVRHNRRRRRRGRR